MVKDSKPLYKPFKSKKAGKKYSVYVKGDNGKVKKINFGNETTTFDVNVTDDPPIG